MTSHVSSHSAGAASCTGNIFESVVVFHNHYLCTVRKSHIRSVSSRPRVALPFAPRRVVSSRMVGVDGLAPGGDAARDVEAGLAREESSDSLDVAPDGSVRPRNPPPSGRSGGTTTTTSRWRRWWRTSCASDRRPRDEDARPNPRRGGRPPARETSSRAQTAPRGQRLPVRVPPAHTRRPRLQGRSLRPRRRRERRRRSRRRARVRGGERTREDGVGVGIGTGGRPSPCRSPPPRRRRQAVPPSRILDARAIMGRVRGVPSV